MATTTNNKNGEAHQYTQTQTLAALGKKGEQLKKCGAAI